MSSNLIMFMNEYTDAIRVSALKVIMISDI